MNNKYIGKKRTFKQLKIDDDSLFKPGKRLKLSSSQILEIKNTQGNIFDSILSARNIVREDQFDKIKIYESCSKILQNYYNLICEVKGLCGVNEKVKDFINKLLQWGNSFPGRNEEEIQLSRNKFRASYKLNIAKIKKDIDESYPKEITIRQLANKYDVSQDTMRRFVKMFVGYTYKSVGKVNKAVIKTSNMYQYGVFLEKYCSLIESNSLIMYFDESSFTNNRVRIKKWSRRA